MSFRIGVIGCGAIAFAQHGPAYARYAAARPGTVLAGCSDLDPGRSAAFARQFGFSHAYTQ